MWQGIDGVGQKVGDLPPWHYKPQRGRCFTPFLLKRGGVKHRPRRGPSAKVQKVYSHYAAQVKPCLTTLLFHTVGTVLLINHRQLTMSHSGRSFLCSRLLLLPLLPIHLLVIA